MAEQTDLEARIRRLEDRTAISETIINYARAIDLNDWTLYASLFTDPVHIDFSEAGLPAADFERDTFVGFARAGLSGFDALQHLSPNHVIEFDAADPDRAVCHSALFAQHHIADAEGGDLYLMRGRYVNEMRRTADGWKIERLTQHISWLDGNTALPAAADAAFARSGQGA